MRLPCPLCGERDIREFGYTGSAALLDRPAPGAGVDAWDGYLHLRDNPAGPTEELWYHAAGCAAWLVVTRDTVTHAVSGARLAADRNVATEPDSATLTGGGHPATDMDDARATVAERGAAGDAGAPGADATLSDASGDRGAGAPDGAGPPDDGEGPAPGDVTPPADREKPS